jgi:hypothetical protein
MRAVAVALLIEEQRGEILAGWRQDVERELGGDPVLSFAVGPLLREMALVLRGDPSPLGPGAISGAEVGARSAVLVRSSAAPARLAREFKLLHRALWQALKASGAVVGSDERRAGDEWLDDALAAALDRQDRLRTRADLLEPAPARGASRTVPPPLPGRPVPEPRASVAPVVPPRPPPLPAAGSAPPPVLAVASSDILGLE